jgi:lipoyl(octanoyl) transferase
MQTILFEHLGILSYKKAWNYQQEVFDRIFDVKKQNRQLETEGKQIPTPNYLLFCQHNPVFTMGKAGSLDNLLLSEKELNQKGIEYFEINRGGDVTFHGLEQLVGYPILDLMNFKQDLHWYFRELEEVIIQTMQTYNLDAGRVEGLTGVWIDPNSENPRKICAIGIRASRWITMHGFALNVNTDLSYFDLIIPCGIKDKGVTSLEKELGEKVEMKEVEERVKEQFEKRFEVKIV